MSTCLQCGTLTKNKKFCCRSCSASFNNKTSPKRQKEKLCESCGTVAVLSDRKYCKDCWETKLRHHRIDEDKVTIHDLQSKKRYQINSRIRMLARSHWKRSGMPFVCKRCNYDIPDVCEICHKKPVCEFDVLTPISQVNDLDNLMCLCPNCHKEEHKGLWSFNDKTN